MGMLARLKEYIVSVGVSVAGLEKAIGSSNASIGAQMRKEGGTIGSDKVEKILSVYGDLSAEWLMRGEGAMLRPIVIADNGSIAAGGDVSGSQTGGVDRSLEEKVRELETENAYLRGQVDLLMKLVRG